MKSQHSRLSGLVLIAFSAAGVLNVPAHADEGVFMDTIVVTGQRENTTHSDVLHVEDVPPVSADTARMISRLPGAALNSNGSLSGQVQYRGASGFRVGTKINQQSFHSGGPNLMDPPMHYAPPVLVDTIQVYRGTADLAFGPSLIGGVNAQLKSVSYTSTEELQTDYDVTAIGRSADNSRALGAVFGLANDQIRAFGLYSTEKGDDKSIPDGEIANTFHEREVFGVGLGLKQGSADWAFEFRRQETGPTGNPPFAMDIDYVETDFSRIAYENSFSNTDVKATVSYSDVDHGMSNFDHRPPPPLPMRYRYTRATAQTQGLALDFKTDTGQREFTYGVDAVEYEFDVLINNPRVATFHVTPLPDISMQRAGLYLNMEQKVGAGMVSVGARVDRHESKAGAASTGPAVPPMAGMLAMQFNASDRDWQDTTTDVLARYWMTKENVTWRASLAQKNRAPTYLERYGWLPIAASAGLADGNNYVGDLELKAERAWIAEFGVELLGNNWRFIPTVFYHLVDDFIQGIPFDDTPDVVNGPVEMVSAMNGDPTPLRFANVDAEMYGLDADFGYQIAPRWRLDGVVSIVRGERRDLSDNLYRISPDKLTLGLTYDRTDWSITLEGVAVSSQTKVSETNSEQETSGYGTLNLHASWQVSDRTFLSAGIENLADREYEDHLAGYNRVRESDVRLGDRIPGVGRNAYIRVSLTR